MVTINCEACTSLKHDNFKITNLLYNHVVKPGDFLNISVTAKCLNTYFKSDGRICIFENDRLVDSSEQNYFLPGQSKTFNFQIRMPNNNLSLNISLLGENIFTYDCEDYKLIFVEAGEHTEPPDDDEYDDGNSIYVFLALGILAGIIIIKLMDD